MANGVPGRAQDQHTAVAKQIIVTVEFEVVELASTHQVCHDEATGAGTALELLRPPALVKLLLLHYVDGVREHGDVADVVQVSMRGYNHLNLVGRVSKLFQLHVDDVGALLAGLQEIAIAWCPIRLAVLGAIGASHVVPGIKYDQTLWVVENPHADRDGDLTRFLRGQRGDQTFDMKRTEHTARGPIQFLSECTGRRCNAEYAQQGGNDFFHGSIPPWNFSSRSCTFCTQYAPVLSRRSGRDYLFPR